MIDRLKKIRVGILGCSDIARRRFLPSLRHARNACLSAVASRDIEKARRFLPSFDHEVAGYDALLANNTVDLVYISLPNHLHEPWVLRALAQGKHVICEKPLALSAEAVKRMTGYAEQKGLLLYENIVYLHHPLHRAVREIVAAGRIGRIRELRTAFGFIAKDSDGFRMKADQGGGAFFDQVRYPVSAAQYFLAGTVYQFKGQAFFRNGLNVSMRVRAVTDHNEQFLFSIGFEQPYECWYEIVGENGMLKVDRAYTTPADMVNVIQVSTDSGMIEEAVPAADHFQLMVEAVCDAIQQGQGYHDLYKRSTDLAQLADRVWDSCERIDLGKEQYLDDKELAVSRRISP